MTETKKNIENTTKRKQYSAPAPEKGLDLLELLSQELNGLTIGEITKRLNRSVGELFRMLVVLEQRGYVELPQNTDKYKLTLKMFGLSNRYPPVKKLTLLAKPEMQKLAYQIEQSCHLAIYYGGKGQVIVQQDSPSDRVFSVRLGAEAPLINTCSGHILLAFSLPEMQKIMISKIPAHHPKIVKGEFYEKLQKIALQGYEKILSEQAHGVTDIGYPIFDHNGDVVAALVVPFLAYLDGSHPIELESAMEFIRQSALQISNLLGYQNI